MPRLSAGAGAALIALAFVCASSRTSAQDEKAGLIDKTTEGVLERVVTDEEGIIVRTDAGQLMGWRLPAPVVREASTIPVGSRVWVIYRRIDPEDMAVTAIGFPGTTPDTVYVNASGYDAILRTAPGAHGRCDGASRGQVSEFDLPKDLAMPAQGGCWCCAHRGETCTPASRSRAGRVVLAQCFGAPAR